jgi:hypothetical protein
MKRVLVVIGIVGLAALLGGCDKCGDYGWHKSQACSKPSIQ